MEMMELEILELLEIEPEMLERDGYVDNGGRETEGRGERDLYKQSYYKESKKSNDISSKLGLNLKAKHLNPNSTGREGRSTSSPGTQ